MAIEPVEIRNTILKSFTGTLDFAAQEHVGGAGSAGRATGQSILDGVGALNLSNLSSFSIARKNITTGLNTNNVYVSQLGGDDINGNGTILYPFKSPHAAYLSITTASQNNPFTIVILGGYVDDSAGQIKVGPNINYLGQTGQTIINNTLPIILDISAWQSNPGAITYLKDLQTNAITLDFSPITTPSAPQIVLDDVFVFSGDVTIKGSSTVTVQLFTYIGFYGNVNLDYVSVLQSIGNTYNNLNLSTLVSGSNSYLIAFCDTINTFHGKGPSSGTGSNFQIKSSLIYSNVNVDGGLTNLIIDSASLSNGPAITQTNGAVITYADSAISITESYTPTNYTALKSTVDSHFRGIDTKLGTLQPAGNYITALTGDVTATGPGSVSSTVNSVGGSTASNVHSAELAANAATASNTISTIVKRDASGNFSAGTITASLSGNATTATTATNFSGSLSGDVTGTQSATVVSLVGGKTASQVASAVNSIGTLSANQMVFTNNSGVLSSNANYGVNTNGGGALSIAGLFTCTSATFSLGGAGASGFNVTGTNPAVNIGSNLTLAQSSSSNAYFTGSAAGDVCLRQNSTGSIRLGIGATAAAFALSSTQLTMAVGIQLPTSGGTAAPLSYNEENQTFAMTMNAPDGTTHTWNLIVTRVGKIVSITWPTLSVTATSAVTFSSSSSNLPSRWRPQNQLQLPINVTNNSVNVSGTMTIGTDGSITVGVGATSSAFTAALTAAIINGATGFPTT